MKYLNFVAAEGRPAREDAAVMQREIPGWEKETQGVRLLGRALDLPHTARTVRFTTGEYIAAIDVVSCADQEQAVQLATTHPAARSHPIEVRPFENE